MNEVDDQALDVAAIEVLVSHNHQGAVTERLDVFLSVDDAKFEAHDFNKVHDLFILHNLAISLVTDVQRLALEWEDAVVVPTNNGKATDRQGLGRISLCNDESAVI